MTLAPIWDQLARDCELLPDELRLWSRRYLKNHRQRYESDLRLLQRFYRGGEVLEIGAAPCQLTVVLQQQGYPVQAVDLAPDRFYPSFASTLCLLSNAISNGNVSLSSGRALVSFCSTKCSNIFASTRSPLWPRSAGSCGQAVRWC